MNPQFTTEQLQGIVSPDKERLIYEIGAKTKYLKKVRASQWDSFTFQLYLFKDKAEYHNVKNKHIATFRLKRWK
jgi:hypothetical protein